MMKAGDVVSYLEMCQREGTQLQRGMNFRLRGQQSVLLMSTRHNAPYRDRVEEEGRQLIYEGHDQPKDSSGDIPKLVDQPLTTPTGRLTQNGLFHQAAERYKSKLEGPELVRVYEKIKDGIWVYNGVFELIDAWIESDGSRQVCRFKLQITDEDAKFATRNETARQLPHDRMIPPSVKIEVWKRDKGRCVKCGSTVNLHFDHILPFSKGGSSLTAQNIQLLCMAHNLEKSNRFDI